MSGFTSRLVNILCALLAYSVSRFLWGEADLVWRKLPQELLTFVILYVLLQVLIRGRKLAKKGKEA